MHVRAARLVGLVALLSTAAVWAQEPVADAAPVAEAPAEPATRMQLPGDLDLRATFQADLLLAFISLGVGGDFGVLPLGPGTLALGAELEVDFCGTFCLAFGALTNTSLSNIYFAPHARVTYHFLPPAKSRRQLEKVDLYAVALGGVTYTRTRFTGDGWDYKGSDVGPSFGLGAGGKYFFRESIFVGGEARLRYSRGTYDYSVRVGEVSESGSYEDWSLSGLQLMFFIGARL